MKEYEVVVTFNTKVQANNEEDAKLLASKIAQMNHGLNRGSFDLRLKNDEGMTISLTETERHVLISTLNERPWILQEIASRITRDGGVEEGKSLAEGMNILRELERKLRGGD